MNFQEDDLDEVVISGIGGKFPNSGSVAELAENLFAGNNLVAKDPRKLTRGFYENLPDCNGVLKDDYGKFDNTFFGISSIVAAAMDTLTCHILQRTFEAIIDAGINPSELRGSNTSIYSGTCHSDSDLEWATDTKAGYGIMGRNRCMNANRVSYWLDLNGTSVSTDSGWTSGLSNLFLGWNAIKSGKCDTAIVSTASLQRHALITIQLKDFGILSPDGCTRTFDDAANGCGRSSAVVVLVLQRKKFARRCYATIGHIYFTCFGDRDEIINKSSQKDWEALFNEFYEKSKIDIKDVYYIEAHGAALKEDDAEELNAITEVFCKDRETPLFVGCVKSNIGHTEASSSLCGIVKALIALENGIIPQNIHYNTPNSMCPGLAKGKLKVVDKNTYLPPNALVAVNCHGFGGTYGHIVLKPNLKNKDLKYDDIPRLLLLADRTNDYMKELLEQVESLPFDPEFIGLLHEIHSKRIEKYLARGYTILPKPENPIHEHQAYDEVKRPVWFVFSGMGSQWPKMGKRLMILPKFRESVEKSHKILEAQGLDLIKIITEDDPKMFENILHSFVGIAAIQIALVDILRELNITPDGLIGHSVGELGCAYADGCFTAEQMILAAYYRGRASKECDLIKGSMAAVGKGYNDIKDQLPEDIEVACHNSDDSCTLSGPAESINKFVDKLKAEGIFARAVNVSNIAYHSRYIRPAAPKLLQYLKQVVTEPKLRSSKWISTSNPENKWDTELAKYCSADYHTNNLLSSVLFEEGSKHIPKNAICIEIAPHGLLQAILKRSLGENVTNISMTNRSAEDPILFLLQSIGKMYMAGMDPQIINLYPKIQYPVSKGTHVLHHLVHWHEQRPAIVVTPMEKKVIYSFKSQLVRTAVDGTGYVVNGQNVYPLTIFLSLAWETFASIHQKKPEECPVVFQNVRVENLLEVNLSEDDNVTITFQSGSGDFEIFTSHPVARGNISMLKEKSSEKTSFRIEKVDLIDFEIYKEIKRKGIEIGKYLRSLNAVNLGEKEYIGDISANSNWVQTIEGLLQLVLLHKEEKLDTVFFPRSFERLEIACLEHDRYKSSLKDTSHLTASYCPTTNIANCAGIHLRGLNFLEVPRDKIMLKFESTNFFSLINPPLYNVLRFADFCFGIVLDNFNALKNVTNINIIEYSDDHQTASMGCYLQQMFTEYKITVKTVLNSALEMKTNQLCEFLISAEELLEKSVNHLVEGGFLLLKINSGKKALPGFNLVGKFLDASNTEYLLLKKGKENYDESNFLTIETNQTNFISTLRDLKNTNKKIYLLEYKDPEEGIDNFKKRIQAETPVLLRWIFIFDKEAPPFNMKSPFYMDQIKKGLTTNVYSNGSWGCFHHFNFSVKSVEDDVNFKLEVDGQIKPSYVAFDLTENLLKLEQIEYSGLINNTKVMGISKMLNHKKIIMDKFLTWEIPESWSLEDGAATPLSYALAYYCLVITARLKSNEKVLVTDGMTCIGQASIGVALSLASRVLVTVNNNEEIAVIKKKFPQLNEYDIISHEDPKFDVYWKLIAKKDYAEVIINMLDGERFFSALKFTGQYGRVFHFGKEDLLKNTQLGSSIFLMSLGFYAKSPDIITKLSEEEKKQLFDLMANGIKSGVVKPLPRMTLTFKKMQEAQRNEITSQKRIKTLVDVSTIKSDLSYIKFGYNNSYLIFGDETDIWVDVVEWLLNRSVQNIVIGRRDHTKRSQLRIPHLQKYKNVFIYDHQDVHKLLQEAQKLGEISSVFYISMNSSTVEQNFMDLDKYYRIPGSHLVTITKSQWFFSGICKARNSSGFPSTNFVWDADELLINQNLENMTKICGKDPVIKISPQTEMSKTDVKIGDLIPSTIEDFCEMGSNLETFVRLTYINTTTGLNRDAIKEFTPLIFIPGLQKDPIKMIEPIIASFLYPAICVQIPDMKLSIPKMASLIVPEILKLQKVGDFNIVGISWGSHLAMELATQLEEVGATVGVTLIEGPIQNVKGLVTKSLETDLLNLLKECSKTTTVSKVQNEIVLEKSWQGQLNKALNVINLPSSKEKDLCRAATFVYNNLQALIDHDTNHLKFKGPLTVIVSQRKYFEEKMIWKICKSISIRSFPVSTEELFSSTDFWKIIHGSAISQAMSRLAIHSCSWQELEVFMKQKRVLKFGDDFQPYNMKFSFSC